MLHIKSVHKLKKGFTLIELVTSIAISSIILITAAHLYNFGVKAYRNEFDKLYVNQNARRALFVLSDNIRKAKSAHILNSKRVEIIDRKNEKIGFLLENGTLYRVKHSTKNPITTLADLKFSKPCNRTYIQIEVVVTKGEQSYKLKTKATPEGQVSN